MTITRKTRYALSKHDVAAHAHDGGLAFPDPDLTLRAMQVMVMLAALLPAQANAPPNPGSWWMVLGLHWVLESAGGDVSLGAAGILAITDWGVVSRQMAAHRVPARWVAVAVAWAAFHPHVRVTEPATC